MNNAKIGGKKTRRCKSSTTQRTIITPIAKTPDGQMYAKTIKLLGDKRILVLLSNGKEIMAIIPGKLKGKNNWIHLNTFVLIQKRDFQKDKVDVVYVYSNNQVKYLQKIGELEEFKIEETEEGEVAFTTEENSDESDNELISKKKETYDDLYKELEEELEKDANDEIYSELLLKKKENKKLDAELDDDLDIDNL